MTYDYFLIVSKADGSTNIVQTEQEAYESSRFDCFIYGAKQDVGIDKYDLVTIGAPVIFQPPTPPPVTTYPIEVQDA